VIYKGYEITVVGTNVYVGFNPMPKQEGKNMIEEAKKYIDELVDSDKDDLEMF
jgi:hypothetical protein